MYETARRMPWVTTYTDARNHYEKVKPIRGDKDQRRPIANRRDKHLWMRMVGGDAHLGGDVQFMLYDTPVVTYHPDNSMTIAVGNWTSHYTCEFICSLLPAVRGGHKSGRMYLKVMVRDPKLTQAQQPQDPRTAAMSAATEMAFAFEKGTTLRIRDAMCYGGAKYGVYEIVDTEQPFMWVPDRAKLTTVRAQYKEFADYFKNIVNLMSMRVEELDEPVYGRDADDPFATKTCVRVSVQTLAEVLGTYSENRGDMHYPNHTITVVDMYSWRGLKPEFSHHSMLHKPTWGTVLNGAANQTQKVRATYTHACEALLQLARSDQPEDNKHANFQKAAMVLLAYKENLSQIVVKEANAPSPVSKLAWPRRLEEYIYRSVSKTLKLFDEFLIRYKAEEVLKRVQMPLGKVPTTNYESYLYPEYRQKA